MVHTICITSCLACAIFDGWMPCLCPSFDFDHLTPSFACPCRSWWLMDGEVLKRDLVTGFTLLVTGFTLLVTGDQLTMFICTNLWAFVMVKLICITNPGITFAQTLEPNQCP